MGRTFSRAASTSNSARGSRSRRAPPSGRASPRRSIREITPQFSQTASRHRSPVSLADTRPGCHRPPLAFPVDLTHGHERVEGTAEGGRHDRGARRARNPADLTAAERRMWEAFRTGSVYDLQRARRRPRTIRTPTASGVPSAASAPGWWPWLLLHGPPPVPGRVASLKLRGVRITGGSTCAGGTVAPYVELQSCRFDSEVQLSEARFGTLRHGELRGSPAGGGPAAHRGRSAPAALPGGPRASG